MAIHNSETQDHHLDRAMDVGLIEAAKPALDAGEPVRIERDIRNVHRTVGAMLSGEVARRYGHAGLPEDTIAIALTGTAGGSFGAFLARGVTLELIGDANDYVGKGLSGGRIVGAPAAGGDARSGREHHRRQHGAVRRDRRRGVFPGRRRRAVRRAQFGRRRGGGGRAATTAANT